MIIVTKVILIINDSESESSSSISTDSELNDYEEDQNIFNDDTEINTAKKKKKHHSLSMTLNQTFLESFLVILQ